MYWYVSREDEIFIDTDNFSRSEVHTSSRLHGAIDSGKLEVKRIEYHKSTTENHVHVLVTLSSPMPIIQRCVWAIIFHSDIYRGCSTIMRAINDVPAADIFITPAKFIRNPDDECNCTEKHRAKIMDICPAAIRLRGNNRMKGFFGKPNREKGSIFK